MPKIVQITEPVLLGEGPHWDAKEEVLYYVDISGFSVHRYDPKTKKDTSLKLENTVGVIVPIHNNPGKFVIGYGTNFAILEWDGYSNNYKLHNKYQVDTDKIGNRFNDGKADKNGNVWIGTMGYEDPAGKFKENQGSLYKVSSEHCQLENKLSPVTLSNGITWSGDYTLMYYIDTPTRKVDVFDYDLKTGSIENRRTFFDFEKNDVKGNPDGMTSDSEDNLWIACWNGSQVIQVSKNGTFMRSLQFPASRITSVQWGGPKLDTLFVTSMKHGLTDEELKLQPSAGAVFSVTGLGTTGRLANAASSCLIEN